MFDNFGLESLRKYEYFRCSLFVVGFIFNLIVLVIFFTAQNMRTSVNYLEANLSIAEIVFTILGIVTSVRLIRMEGQYGDMITDQFGSGSIASVLLFTIIAISIYRYRLIQNPSKFETNPRSIVYGICAIWFAALVLNGVSVTLNHFLVMQRSTSNISNAYIWSTALIGTAIPFLSLFAITMLYAISYSQSTIYGVVGQQAMQNANYVWTRKNEIRTMLITVVLFAVSWSPLILYFFQFLLLQLGVDVPVHYIMFWPGGAICRTIFILHVVCLPIMHYFTNSGYRSGFNKLVGIRLRTITGRRYEIPVTHNRS